jgi:hypothetical protein
MSYVSFHFGIREDKVGLIALLRAKVYVLVTDRQGAANSGTIWSWVSDNLHLLGGQRVILLAAGRPQMINKLTDPELRPSALEIGHSPTRLRDVRDVS